MIDDLLRPGSRKACLCECPGWAKVLVDVMNTPFEIKGLC
jgi:hypothetical protein